MTPLFAIVTALGIFSSPQPSAPLVSLPPLLLSSPSTNSYTSNLFGLNMQVNDYGTSWVGAQFGFTNPPGYNLAKAFYFGSNPFSFNGIIYSNQEASTVSLIYQPIKTGVGFGLSAKVNMVSNQISTINYYPLSYTNSGLFPNFVWTNFLTLITNKTSPLFSTYNPATLSFMRNTNCIIQGLKGFTAYSPGSATTWNPSTLITRRISPLSSGVWLHPSPSASRPRSI